MRHGILVLLVVPLLTRPARAEDITLIGVDVGSSHGLVVESTQLLLGPSTSLADYQTRLAHSGLATVAALTAQAGGQFLLQVHGMPRLPDVDEPGDRAVSVTRF